MPPLAWDGRPDDVVLGAHAVPGGAAREGVALIGREVIEGVVEPGIQLLQVRTI